MFYNADVLIDLDLSMIDSSINNSMPLDEEYFSSLTWDEFFNKLAPALKEYDESVKRIINPKNGKASILACGDDVDLVQTLAVQYDYPFLSYKNNRVSVDFNNKEIENMLINLNQYIKEGFITTASLNNVNYISEYISEGNSLFLVDNIASINYIEPDDKQLGISRIFKGKNEISSSITGANITLLNHEDDNRALASFLFAKFLLQNENLYKFLTRYAPFKKSLLNYDNYLNTFSEGISSYTASLLEEFLKEYSDTFYSPNPYIYIRDIENIVYNSLSTDDTSLIKDYLSDAERLEEILNW